MQAKIVNLRQAMDTLFESAMNGANHCQNENENAEKAKNEQLKWQNDKKEERLRIIHSKQLHEIKKKLKDWMEYANKQEQRAKIYKKQLQNLHKQQQQRKPINKMGTPSRAETIAIPESKEND